MSEPAAIIQARSPSPYFAAIDLGSNSFHMLVVKINTTGGFEVIDRVKDMVQIAKGLSASGILSDEAQTRALDCLACFRERLRDIPDDHVRVVGTKALRSAANAMAFLNHAESVLGHPINIVSGYEEARLVYLGAAPNISADKGRRLIIDIGGGSTEFILGHDQQPDYLESLSIGCVTYTDRFSQNGIINADSLTEIYLATCAELEAICTPYRDHGWDICVGTSGTMRAIASLMPGKTDTGIITADYLTELFCALKTPEGPALPQISARRRAVLPAGVAILMAIFNELALSEIHVLKATLKEGLIYDTLGRLSHEDRRDGTVQALMTQYRVDTEQARRVSDTLQHFFSALPTPIINGIAVDKLLHWAALLHEIGLCMSHSGYHHHGYYLLKHSDLAGFGRLEQELLALLVGTHRRKIRLDQLSGFSDITQQHLRPLFICLRLAVILNHRRENNQDWPAINFIDNTVALVFPQGWLAAHPLSYRHLEKERAYLAAINIQLTYH